MGTTHLFLLASKGFLRPAAHEGVPRRRIHSELSPGFGSLQAANLILFSLNAGQVELASVLVDLYNLKIAADTEKVNESFWQTGHTMKVMKMHLLTQK